MTATTLAVLTLLAVIGVLAYRETRPDTAGCEFNGCRRVAVTSKTQWHPAGGMTIALCVGHAQRWDAPPYNRAVDAIEDWANRRDGEPA